MSAGNPEELATTALREWLLLRLPAKVTEVNLLRAAVVRAPWAGPYTIPAGGTLGIGVTIAETFVSVALTSGSRTAAQLATDINAATGLSGVASADSDGRLVLTSPTPPTTSTASTVRVRGNTAADVNSVLGLDSGGVRRVTQALVAPGSEGIHDGWPVVMQFGAQQAIGNVIVALIGDRKTNVSEPGPRGDRAVVTTDLTILLAVGAHRHPEGIQSAVRCVRELLLSDLGKRLGVAVGPGVQGVLERSGTFVRGKPIAFGTRQSPGPLYDAAVMNLDISLFAVPSPT